MTSSRKKLPQAGLSPNKPVKPIAGVHTHEIVWKVDQVKMDRQIRAIAAATLGVGSLVPQGSDREDFRELSVETIYDLLVVAYKAGMAAAKDR